MKGKRDKRRALKAWRRRWLWEPTDPKACTCLHDGLEPCWHRPACPVFRSVWDERP